MSTIAEFDAEVPEWLRRVRVGDVLRSPRGRLRIVRYVSNRRGMPFYFGFAIRRCSWTTRCTTLKCRSELFGWQPTGRRVELRERLDREIDKDFRRGRSRLTCCDVEGVS